MYDRDRQGGSFRDNDRDRGFRSREGDRPGFRDDRGGGGFRDDRGGGFRDDRGGGGFRDDRGGGFRDDRGGGFRDGGFRDSGFERRDDRRDDRRGGGDLGDKGGWRRDPEPRDADPPPERSEFNLYSSFNRPMHVPYLIFDDLTKISYLNFAKKKTSNKIINIAKCINVWNK